MSAKHLSLQDLKKEATNRKIKGRSKMNREELCYALGYIDCGKRKSATSKT